jgi:hypothetical protein
MTAETDSEPKENAEENEESDMTDTEFEDFVLSNREKIISILEAEKEEAFDLIEKKKKKSKKKVKKKIEKGKSKAESVAKDITVAMLTPEVQKHFVTMGIEMMMGMEAFMRALPMKGFVKEAFDGAEHIRETVSDTYCDTNPRCSKKSKPSTSKIEID